MYLGVSKDGSSVSAKKSSRPRLSDSHSKLQMDPPKLLDEAMIPKETIRASAVVSFLFITYMCEKKIRLRVE